jgi:TPP-dependent pyruvate/acetoin dehydrogenase alpha subunit
MRSSTMVGIEELYRRMLTIRVLEDRLQRYCDEGLAGDLHFNKGQEAIAVGVCAALRQTDKIVTHHRTIAHQVAKGAELRPLVAELLGKSTGVNGGRAGEMHISDRDIGHDFSFQLVGTCIPVGAGLAWALRRAMKTDDVVAIFFGDAAASNGQFHEGLNLIAIHKLPVLLVCENNCRAGNITYEHYSPRGMSVSARVDAYGIPTWEADGNDVRDVASQAEHLIELARPGRPQFLECFTERLCWHKQGQRDVRTKAELEAAAAGDPLATANIPSAVLLSEVANLKRVEGIVDGVLASVVRDLPPTY